MFLREGGLDGSISSVESLYADVEINEWILKGTSPSPTDMQMFISLEHVL